MLFYPIILNLIIQFFYCSWMSDREDKSKLEEKKDPLKTENEVQLYRPGMNFPLVKVFF